MNKLSGWDRFLMSVAPTYAAKRIRAKNLADILARNYEAASSSRRTSGWTRNYGDVNSITARALHELRAHARDLERNNSWATRAVEVITGNTISWGITPKAVGGDTKRAIEVWNSWAETTDCDTDGKLTFNGIQEMALAAIVVSGEVLIRRRFRRPEDGFAIPMQLQVLEPDMIDTGKDGVKGLQGGPVIQGVEFDAIGRRVAYYLFDAHPGSGSGSGQSARVSAANILHIFRPRRAGQVRGVSWFAQTITPLKDFDEFEDAQLMKQKIAACLVGAVVDPQGSGTAMGEEDDDDNTIETFEPGMFHYFTPGQDVKFNNPPTAMDDGFSTRTLRKVAAGLGVPYEEMTGDYSQVNFSSARMARLSHWANVYKWRHNMIIPQLCDGVWKWAMEAADIAGLIKGDLPRAKWTAPPMPMIEPDKEGLALSRLVRAGVMTHDDMVREQGGDPDAHWDEYAASLAKLDALKIKLDSDVRAVSQAGLTQERVGAGGGAPPAAADDRNLAVVLERLLNE
jgi:lambda family phage portal protein